MDKTIKIKNFLENKASNFVDSKTVYKTFFINKIREKIENIVIKNNTNFNNKTETKIKKINNDKITPLLYNILKKVKYPNEKINDYNYFLSWYRENSTKLNLKELISKSLEDYKKIFDENLDREKLNELLYENRFVSLDIIHCAETADLNYRNYYKKSNNSFVDLYIYDLENDKKYLNISYVVGIIDFFRQITKKDLNVSLVTFLCHQKRYFPNLNNNIIINPENINGGSTISEIFIYIWRQEEFYKVFIHELIHYFTIDFHDQNNKQIEEIRDSLFNIKGVDVINETYTELLALTFYSVFYSLISDEKFDTIINNENLFTHFQIAKIIYFFGGKKYEDLFKIEIVQKTSLVSYVIVKGMFLNNYEKILDHYNKYTFLEFDRVDRFKDYIRLYKDIVKKDSLNKEIINNFLKIIENDKELKNKFIMKTLRMTMYG